MDKDLTLRYYRRKVTGDEVKGLLRAVFAGALIVGLGSVHFGKASHPRCIHCDNHYEEQETLEHPIMRSPVNQERTKLVRGKSSGWPL